MTNRSACPSRRVWKTSHCPSGDHPAEPTSGPLKKVIWIGCEPSAFAIHSSSEPDRSDTNEILFPSGEYLAFPSGSVVEMSNSGTPGGSPGTAILARQILVSSLCRE